MQDLVSLLPILGIFLVFWLLIIRPAQRRQKALKEVQQQITVGDRVITGSGIFGTIASEDGDRFGLEIADGVIITVARQSVVGTVDDEERDAAGADEIHETPAEEPATPADNEAPGTHKEL
ncbi:MAG: preprotein translocase subunit YajC [Nocardioides sp.]